MNDLLIIFATNKFVVWFVNILKTVKNREPNTTISQCLFRPYTRPDLKILKNKFILLDYKALTMKCSENAYKNHQSLINLWQLNTQLIIIKVVNKKLTILGTVDYILTHTEVIKLIS